MDLNTILSLATMGAAVVVPFIIIAIRDVKNASRLKTILRDFGISRLVHRWSNFGATVSGFWNEMPVSISLRHPRGESQTKIVQVQIQVNLEYPGSLYLRNRARPMMYDWTQRSMSNWKLPPVALLDSEEDRTLFLCNTDQPELARRLVGSIATRKQIFQNLIDGDGELALESGKLKVVRLNRMNWNFKDPAITQQLEKILKEEWDLIRTIIAVLQPLRLQVSDRAAAVLECPFCKNQLDEILSLVKCSGCRTYHHQSCWLEHGRCSVYGCNGFAVPVSKSMIYNSANRLEREES